MKKETMNNYLDIAVVGDYNFNFSSHVATNRALTDVGNVFDLDINFFWVDSKELQTDTAKKLSRFDGIFLAPGPYANARGIIQTVEYARTKNVPFLGTSAGCQFAILEFTQNVLEIQEASSFFTAEGKGVITRKDNQSNSDRLELESIFLIEGSKTFTYFPQNTVKECASKKLSISGELMEYLVMNGLKPAGIDDDGDVRIFENVHNDFFVGTMYLPQLTSRGALPHPIISNFVKASQKYRQVAFSNESLAAY